jgi:hypothetical protein
MYKATLKQIWTHGMQLWGTASTSNIEILERFQSKALRMIVDAPNTVTPRDLQTPTDKEEILHYSSPQRTPKRPSTKPHGATRQQAIAETPAK